MVSNNNCYFSAERKVKSGEKIVFLVSESKAREAYVIEVSTSKIILRNK